MLFFNQILIFLFCSLSNVFSFYKKNSIFFYLSPHNLTFFFWLLYLLFIILKVIYVHKVLCIFFIINIFVFKFYQPRHLFFRNYPNLKSYLIFFSILTLLIIIEFLLNHYLFFLNISYFCYSLLKKNSKFHILHQSLL